MELYVCIILVWFMKSNDNNFIMNPIIIILKIYKYFDKKWRM